jgi:hypothetical protein
MYFSPHSNAIWRHDKVVRNRKSSATSRHSFINTVCDIKVEMSNLLIIPNIINIYLTLCTFSFEIKESSLPDTRCRIQDVVLPHCVDKRMARRCRRFSIPNYLETVSLEMRIWPWIRDTQYEWMNTKQSVCLHSLHWCISPRIPMRYDVMTR